MHINIKKRFEINTNDLLSIWNANVYCRLLAVYFVTVAVFGTQFQPNNQYTQRDAHSQKCHYLRLTQYLFVRFAQHRQLSAACLRWISNVYVLMYSIEVYCFLTFVLKPICRWRLVWLCFVDATVDLAVGLFCPLYYYCFYLQHMRTLNANCLNLFLFS